MLDVGTMSSRDTSVDKGLIDDSTNGNYIRILTWPVFALGLLYGNKKHRGLLVDKACPRVQAVIFRHLLVSWFLARNPCIIESLQYLRIQSI